MILQLAVNYAKVARQLIRIPKDEGGEYSA